MGIIEKILYQGNIRMDDRFNLSWDDFQTSTISSIKDLLNDEQFTDVTLACDDGKQVKAHKIILSSCSSFLKNIFVQNPHPQPLVYISDISWGNLNRILQFMYLGSVEVEEKELQSFMNTANKLKVKGLNIDAGSRNVIQHRSEYMPKYAEKKRDEFSEHILGVEIGKYQSDYADIGNQVQQVEDALTIENWKNEMDDNHYNVENYESQIVQNQHQQLYCCEKCNYKSNRRYNVKKHNLSVHDGVRYPCNQCDFKATETGDLKKHQRRQHGQ